MPAGDRPREKALLSGMGSLSDGELLELSERLLADHDGLLGLARLDLGTLIRSHGLGLAKASEIKAAIEMARRIARSAHRRERPRLRTAEEVAEYLSLSMVVLGHEELWCLALDARSRLIGEPRVVSTGDVDGTDAAPRAFYRLALIAGATSCIAVHNHPTGDPSPSPHDHTATMRLVAAGRLLDLPLNDHVVVGDAGRFVSLRRAAPECFR